MRPPVFTEPRQVGEALGICFSEQQSEAIGAPLEPGVIIAGAGSGKTTVMAARVVWLVGSGQVVPEQVLGLTFTRKAAAELSGRVRAALERAGVLDRRSEEGEELVLTYDAFAGRLVREYGLLLGLEGNARLITGAARYRLAARVVADAPGPFEYLSRLRPGTVDRSGPVTGRRVELPPDRAGPAGRAHRRVPPWAPGRARATLAAPSTRRCGQLPPQRRNGWNWPVWCRRTRS